MIIYNGRSSSELKLGWNWIVPTSALSIGWIFRLNAYQNSVKISRSQIPSWVAITLPFDFLCFRGDRTHGIELEPGHLLKAKVRELLGNGNRAVVPWLIRSCVQFRIPDSLHRHELKLYSYFFSSFKVWLFSVITVRVSRLDIGGTDWAQFYAITKGFVR